MAVLFPLVAAMAFACGGKLVTEEPRDPAAAVDAEGAVWVLVTPPLEEVRVAALRLLVNVEGLLGVVDLVRESYEVDLSDEDVLEDLGIAPEMPLVALGVEEGACLVLGAGTGASIADILQRVGETSGYVVEHRLAEEGRLTRVCMQDRCPVALLRLEGLVLLGYDEDGRADAAVARVALHHLPSDSPGVRAAEGRFVFEWRGDEVDDGPPDVSGWPGPLAGVGHWLHSVRGGIGGLRLSAAADIDGIDWDLEIRTARGRANPADDDSAAPVDWKDALPEDTILTVQLSGDPGGTLGDLLGGKGMYILGLLAGEVLPEKHVAVIRDALGAMDARAAVALLGADPRAPVKEIIAPGSVRQALNAVHGGLVVRGAPPARILDLIPTEDGPVEGGWRARMVSPSAPRAVEFCKTLKDRSLCLGVIAGEDRLMAVSGKGETARVVRVWTGAAPALGSALFVGNASGSMVLTLKLKRLVRDMSSKGVPPFYLRMVNSFLEVQAVRTDSPRGSRIRGEVLLR